MAYDASIGLWLSRDPSGIAGGANPYEAFNNDPINWDDPDGLTPQPATQPASPTYYGGTFLDNMTPAAAAALYKALVAAAGSDLNNQQAFSIPLTDADASIYLQAMGKSFLYVTPGMMRDGLEKGTAPGFAEDSYADALKKNPALGMTRDQYYRSLAADHNIAMARDVMQMSRNAMANLYARLALPTANLIATSVMAPTAIPPGGAFYTPGYGPSATVVRAGTAAAAQTEAAVTRSADPYLRVTSEVPYTTASKVLNLGGAGEFPGAINMNNGATGIPNLLNRNMLEPWPLAGNSMEAVVGNRLPGFTSDQYRFIAGESYHVLKPGGQIRLFSLSAPVQSVKDAVTAAGFQNIRVEGITVIGTK